MQKMLLSPEMKKIRNQLKMWLIWKLPMLLRMMKESRVAEIRRIVRHVQGLIHVPDLNLEHLHPQRRVGEAGSAPKREKVRLKSNFTMKVTRQSSIKT